MTGSNRNGLILVAVWASGAGAVLFAAALTEWLCPDASHGYQLLLWSLFLVTPIVYTIVAWRTGPGGSGGMGGRSD